MFILFLVRFRFLSGNLWEIAVHSVDHMFSLYFDCFFRFGFEGWIWVLIASVPDLCILFTFIIGKIESSSLKPQGMKPVYLVCSNV